LFIGLVQSNQSQGVLHQTRDTRCNSSKYVSYGSWYSTLMEYIISIKTNFGIEKRETKTSFLEVAQATTHILF